MTFPLFLAVTIRILANPLANVFQKQLVGRRFSPFLVNTIVFAILGLVLLPMVATNAIDRLGSSFWWNALAVGVLSGIGNGLLVAAMRCGELSILGPINAYKSVIAILFGILLLGEMPTLTGLGGIALIIIGSYAVVGMGRGNGCTRQADSHSENDANDASFVVTGENRSAFRLFARSDIQLRLWAMVFSAIEAIFIKRVIQHSDPKTALLAWCWLGAAASLLMLVVARRFHTERKGDGGFIALIRNHPFRLLLLVASIGAMQWTTNYSFALMPVGYALALFQLSALVSVLFGYLFFRECNIRRKLGGTFLMVVGAVLIALS